MTFSALVAFFSEHIQLKVSVQTVTLVLTWVCQLLIIGWPPMSWLKLGARDERAARIWVGGLAVITLSAMVLGLLQRANVFSAFTMVAGVGLFLEAMRQEAGKRPCPWQWGVPPLALLLLVYLVIDWLGLYPSLGVGLTSLALALLDAALMHAVYTVGWPMRSRGLLMVAAGIVPVFFINAARLVHVVAEGQAQALFTSSPLANAIVLSFMIFSVLLTVGYLTFTFEKTHHRDMQALEEANRRLGLVATVDNLTGLWNRRRFDEVVASEISRADRHGLPLSLVIFDVDHFKAINDTHGHAAGDRVLVELSDVARQVVRTSDQLFRWGGEEFLLVLPNTPLEGAIAVSEKLRARLAQHEIPGLGVVTASFGVAAHERGQTLGTWMRRVDAALYEAKGAGRNVVKAAA